MFNSLASIQQTYIYIYIAIYCCSLLCNLPVNLMYKLERIQRRAIRVLYKLNVASLVSISDLMR